MSTFDNKSLKILTLKSTTTHQCSLQNLLNQIVILPFHQFIITPLTSDNFSNTTYEVDVPSIYNDWGDYERKYGEESLNINNSRSIKQTLKQHVQKYYEIFFE